MVALGEHRIEFAADELVRRMNDYTEQWLRSWLMFRDSWQAELRTSEQAGVVTKTLLYHGKLLARLSFKLSDDGAILMLPEDLTR